MAMQNNSVNPLLALLSKAPKKAANPNATPRVKKPKVAPQVIAQNKVEKAKAENNELEKMRKMYENSDVLQDHLERRNQLAIQKGTRFIGSLCYFDLSIDEVPRDRFEDMIINNPNIPDSWKPAPIDCFSQYLMAISDVSKWGSSRFKDHLSEDGVRGYIVKKIKHDRHDKMVFIHQIWEVKSSQVDVEGEEREGYEVENNIKISLSNSGSGAFQDLHVGEHEGDRPLTRDEMARFEPFIKSLKINWTERCMGAYKSEEIRRSIVDILTKKCKAPSITRGLYYVMPRNIPFVLELSKTLREIHPGIKLSMIHLDDNKYDEDNAVMIQDISDQLSANIYAELKNLNEELEQKEDGKIQHGTVGRRLALLEQIEEMINSYEDLQLFDVMEVKRELEKTRSKLGDVADFEFSEF